MNKPTIVAPLLSLCSSGSGRISHMRFSCLRFLLCCLWLFAGLLLAGRPVQAQTKAGDVLVIDQTGGTNGRGALFVVNPATGQRKVLSDVGNLAQGLGADLYSVAVGATGQIFITDFAALREVDPITGNRTVLSDFLQGDIQGFFYYGLAVNAKGKVIANLRQLDDLGLVRWAIVQIDPETDERALITEITNTFFITDLALERSGKILIGTDNGSFEILDAAIFRVHPVTGKLRLLSDFANPDQGIDAGDLHFSRGLVVEASRNILVASGGGLDIAPRNLLLRIDSTTGQRTVLSDFDNPAQGHIGVTLSGVAVEESGEIIVGAVSDLFLGTYSLYRVEPTTGQRTLLSDSNNPAQGPSFSGGVVYIAVVPKDSNAEDHD